MLFCLVESMLSGDFSYRQTKEGWSDRDKREEMFEDEAMYLIATSTGDDNEMLGYSHFRFDMDYGKEVLYV